MVAHHGRHVPPTVKWGTPRNAKLNIYITTTYLSILCMPTLSNPALESTPTLEGEGSSVARATELITSDNSRTGTALANPSSARAKPHSS